MANRTYERLVQTACGISLLVLLAATEKAFPSLNAPSDAAQEECASRQQADPAADPSSAPKPDKSRVALGPIYPDLWGRLSSGSHAPESCDRAVRRSREFASADATDPSKPDTSGFDASDLFIVAPTHAPDSGLRTRLDGFALFVFSPLLHCCISTTGPPLL